MLPTQGVDPNEVETRSSACLHCIREVPGQISDKYASTKSLSIGSDQLESEILCTPAMAQTSIRRCLIQLFPQMKFLNHCLQKSLRHVLFVVIDTRMVFVTNIKPSF